MTSHHLLEIRPLDWDSLAAVAAIERDAFGEEALTTQQLALLTRSGRVFVLTVGTEIVAESIVLPTLRAGEFLLFSLAVLTSHQRRGFGKTLLNHVLTQLTSTGATLLELTVDPQNRSAVVLYTEQFGFERVRQEPDCFGPGHPRLILRKRLDT